MVSVLILNSILALFIAQSDIKQVPATKETRMIKLALRFDQKTKHLTAEVRNEGANDI